MKVDKRPYCNINHTQANINHHIFFHFNSGKGLGRTETGMTDALKPKLKFDKAGVSDFD